MYSVINVTTVYGIRTVYATEVLCLTSSFLSLFWSGGAAASSLETILFTVLTLKQNCSVKTTKFKTLGPQFRNVA